MSTQAHTHHYHCGGDALRAHVPGRGSVRKSRLPDGQARLPGAGRLVLVLAQSFERLLLSRGHGPDLQHVVLRWYTREVGRRTVDYCEGVFEMLVLAGCVISITVLLDVLGN